MSCFHCKLLFPDMHTQTHSGGSSKNRQDYAGKGDFVLLFVGLCLIAAYCLNQIVLSKQILMSSLQLCHLRLHAHTHTHTNTHTHTHTQAFALEYYRNNPEGAIKSEDGAYMLSFAIMMLHTSLHNPSVRHRTTTQQWVSMNRGE